MTATRTETLALDDASQLRLTVAEPERPSMAENSPKYMPG